MLINDCGYEEIQKQSLSLFSVLKSDKELLDFEKLSKEANKLEQTTEEFFNAELRARKRK